MTRERLAYLAGFVDGEGCIGVYHNRNSYKVQFYLAQDNEPFLLALLDEINCGGCVYKGNPRGYGLRLFGQNAINFLKQLLPYLQIKREQAVGAITFWEEFNKNKYKHTASDREYYLWCVQNIKQLKQSNAFAAWEDGIYDL